MNTENITISIVSGLIGFLLGYIVRLLMEKNGYGKDMKNVVLIIVCTAWFASIAVELLNPAYHTNPMVHALMGSIVGFFYKIDIGKKEKK